MTITSTLHKLKQSDIGSTQHPIVLPKHRDEQSGLYRISASLCNSTSAMAARERRIHLGFPEQIKWLCLRPFQSLFNLYSKSPHIKLHQVTTSTEAEPLSYVYCLNTDLQLYYSVPVGSYFQRRTKVTISIFRFLVQN